MLQLLCPNGDCHSEISFENNNRRIMMSNTGDAVCECYSLRNTYLQNVEKMKSLAPRMNWICNIVHHFDHNIISITKKTHRKILLSTIENTFWAMWWCPDITPWPEGCGRRNFLGCGWKSPSNPPPGAAQLLISICFHRSISLNTGKLKILLKIWRKK